MWSLKLSIWSNHAEHPKGLVQLYTLLCFTFPQNLRPLFTLLPLEMTSVDNVMQVVWTDKTSLQFEQLSGFVSIRKYRIIRALQWLVANNPLYENIQINHRLLETWEDKFIPSGIMDNIVHCNANQH